MASDPNPFYSASARARRIARCIGCQTRRLPPAGCASIQQAHSSAISGLRLLFAPGGFTPRIMRDHTFHSRNRGRSDLQMLALCHHAPESSRFAAGMISQKITWLVKPTLHAVNGPMGAARSRVMDLSGPPRFYYSFWPFSETNPLLIYSNCKLIAPWNFRATFGSALWNRYRCSLWTMFMGFGTVCFAMKLSARTLVY
ncbi:hypothetical protein BJX76DRAFT_267924 [Aspergillus varians]